MSEDENAAIARLGEEARERAGPQLARDLRVVLAALNRETERARRFQRERAELADQLHGTPCAQIAGQQECDALRAELGEEKAWADRTHQALQNCLNELGQRLFELAKLATTKAEK